MQMRPKTVNRDLPPRMLRRTRTLKSGKVWESFYYNGKDASGRRVEIALGPDLNEAKRKWAELECRTAPVETGLMRFVFDRYLREILPTKAPKTQADYRGSIDMLRKVFDAVPVDAISPQHIAIYRDKRSQKAAVRANREISVFSTLWNMAREWGYTEKENPAKGVRKNKETPRSYYAASDVWSAVYAQAPEELQDAMDINYLTGQRPADVLKMRLSDIRENALEVTQNKTTKKLRILLEVAGVPTELGNVIERIKGRPRKVASLSLIATPAGAALNRWTLRTRFDEARAKAAGISEAAGDAELAQRIREFQFRDIRPKAASETDLDHASRLLGHTKQEITRKVYRRVGETVNPTK